MRRTKFAGGGTHRLSQRRSPAQLRTLIAEKQIRDRLERRFGYSFCTVYADIEGLAEFMKRWPKHALMDL